MLYKPYYIINNSEQLGAIAKEQTTGFIYLLQLDTASSIHLRDFVKIIFTGCVNEFCVLLTAEFSTSDIRVTVENIVALSFHYNYTREELSQLIIYVEKDMPETLQQLKKEATAQGYDKIDIRVLKPGVGESIGGYNEIFIKDIETIEQQYYNYLITTTEPARQPVIRLCEAATITPARLKENLYKAELQLKAKQPGLYNLLELTNKYRKANVKLKGQLAYYEEAVEAKKSYTGVYAVSDSIYQKKITDITDFYQYEYEILPGWFKKLGHIIKAMMGKRTWRSLYNDNVKKYKK